jgi:uncharacterized repeat protein (TIGR03803 family)
MKNQIVLFLSLGISLIAHKTNGQGQLWGATTYGGDGDIGIIYKLNSDGSGYSIQKSLTGDPNSPGSSPRNDLVQAANGKLYGTTIEGGANNQGVLFEYDPTNNTFLKIFDFSSAASGANPVWGLTLASNGKLYGTTNRGGSSDKGVLFEFDPISKNFSKKIDFSSSLTGYKPSGSLTLASNGRLYGMMENDGTFFNGLIFEYNTITNVFTKKVSDLYIAVGGAGPQGSLKEASGGKFYGLTSGGGLNGLGVIFEFDIASGNIVKKFDFNLSTEGQYPTGGLTLADNGKLYGMAYGGTKDKGVLFEFEPINSVYSKRVDFGDGNNSSNPQYNNLVLGRNGKIYGMTNYGNNNLGDIFEFDPITGSYIVAFGFNSTDGQNPIGNSLFQASNGKFYGMTSVGGISKAGVLFEFDPISKIYTKKVDFVAPSNGALVRGSLILSSITGKLYGITWRGGSTNRGVLFEYDPISKDLIKKIDFDDFFFLQSLTESTDGKFYCIGYNSIYQYDPTTNNLVKKIELQEPLKGIDVQPILLSYNNKLYGVTSKGGIYGLGVLFEYNPSTNEFLKKIDFDGSPYDTWCQVNGKIYGATSQGGTNNKGVLLEYDPMTENSSTKYNFSVIDGYELRGLTAGGNGKLYGVTNQGGTYGYGAIFEFDVVLNVFTKRVNLNSSFSNRNIGASPQGITFSNNGKLYGTVSQNWFDPGFIYEYDPTTNEFLKKNDFSLADGYGPIKNLLFTPNNLTPPESQTISFSILLSKTMGDPAFTLNALTSSSLPITYTSTSNNITISNNQVSILGAGSTTITANQEGNGYYNPATPVSQTFCINPEKPTITVTNSNSPTQIFTSNAPTGNQWFFNGEAIGGASNQTYVATQQGLYKVQVTIGGCFSDFSNQEALVVTGDVLNANTSVELYPNPTTDRINISLADMEGDKKITIYQITSQLLMTQELSGNSASFNVREYPKGIYIVKVSNQEVIKILRFFKQ